MRKLVGLLSGAVIIFLLGGLAGGIVSWELYQRGIIFNEKYVPNPVVEATEEGRYDDAVRDALADIHDEQKDYFQYIQVATVYLQRAYKDETNREQWVQKGVTYLDKEAALGPSDPVNLFEVAAGYDHAGDLSKNGCPLYEKGAKLCETVNSLLRSDGLMVKDRKFPTQGMRRDNQALQKRLAEKLNSWCSKNPSQK